MTNEIPKQLGAALGARYCLERELGRGGMATVYLAQDLKHQREVAIKVLRADVAASLGAERFVREIEIAAHLSHPNILPLHDSGDAGGTLYYVMPFVEGESLRDRLRRERQLPIDEAIQITREVAGALSYAHSRGVVHRDIKPENILLQSGHAVVADFGIARAITSAQTESLTATGIGIGTPAYMSPEQAAGAKDTDGRGDIYALGCVLYEMLAGHPPFTGNTAQEVMARHTLDPVPSLRAARLTIPAAIEDAVRRALAKTPADRFSTADEFSSALTRARPARAVFPGAVRVWVGTGAAVALVVAGVILTRRTTRASNDDIGMPPPRVSPFLSGEAVEKQPAWNASETFIAFVSDESGNDDVWICDRSCTTKVNLTANYDGVDAFPVWSPTGDRIAFYSERDGGGIYTMSALGAEVRKVVALAPSVLYTFSLQWAANGRLVYTRFDDAGLKQVFSAAETGASSCLTCGLDAEGHSGSLSPSGDFLAFKSAEMGPRGSLFVGDLRSGRVRLVESRVDRPQWHPTRNRLLFISDRDGARDLWSLALNDNDGAPTGEAHRMTSALNVIDYSVAPSGAILAQRSRESATLWSFPLTLPSARDLAAGEQLTTTQEFVDGRPRWSATRHAIFFDSDRRGSTDIWRLSLPGKELTRLTSASAREHRPRVSPDGNWIAYDVVGERNESVHLMRSDGTGSHPLDSLLAPPGGTCCADWSPDGTRLSFYYAVSGGSVLGMATIDPATGTASSQRTYDLPGQLEEYFRWSPDGRFVAYEAYSAGSWDLWVVAADGSGGRRLTTEPGNERQAAWTRDSRSIFFVKDSRRIDRLELDARGYPVGQSRRWLVPPAGFAVSNDGIDVTDTHLITSIRRVASDIWLVEWPAPPGPDSSAAKKAR